MAAAQDPITKASEPPSPYELFASARNDKLRESHQKELERLSGLRSLESNVDRLEAHLEFETYQEDHPTYYSKEHVEAELIQAWKDFLKCEGQFNWLKSSLQRAFDPNVLAQRIWRRGRG